MSDMGQKPALKVALSYVRSTPRADGQCDPRLRARSGNGLWLPSLLADLIVRVQKRTFEDQACTTSGAFTRTSPTGLNFGHSAVA